MHSVVIGSVTVCRTWKRRLRTRTRKVTRDGQQVEVETERLAYLDIIATVRAFYLDLAEWALEDPSRLGRVGRALSDQPGRPRPALAGAPPQGTHGQPHPRTTARACRSSVGAVEAPGSTAAAGRRAAIAQRPLMPGGGPVTCARHPAAVSHRVPAGFPGRVRSRPGREASGRLNAPPEMGTDQQPGSSVQHRCPATSPGHHNPSADPHSCRKTQKTLRAALGSGAPLAWVQSPGRRISPVSAIRTIRPPSWRSSRS